MDGYKTFNTAPFASYTTKELEARVAIELPMRSPLGVVGARERMVAEIARRARRDAGDVTVMTPGEHLRRFQAVA